jgi:hypothetical protein
MAKALRDIVDVPREHVHEPMHPPRKVLRRTVTSLSCPLKLLIVFEVLGIRVLARSNIET